MRAFDGNRIPMTVVLSLSPRVAPCIIATNAAPPDSPNCVALRPPTTRNRHACVLVRFTDSYSPEDSRLRGRPSRRRPADGTSRHFRHAQSYIVEDVYRRAHIMTETLSIRLDANTKKRLDALAKRSRRSKSFLAAEAIAAYVEAEEWQLGELQVGISDLDSGQVVSHEKVSKWLRSWGKAGETKAPR